MTDGHLRCFLFFSTPYILPAPGPVRGVSLPRASRSGTLLIRLLQVCRVVYFGSSATSDAIAASSSAMARSFLATSPSALSEFQSGVFGLSCASKPVM